MSLAVTASVVAIAGTVTNMVGAGKAGKDQQAAYEQQAAISAAEAAHRKQVAYYNADIFKQHAARIRGEQVKRINDYLAVASERLQDNQDQILQRGVEEENKVRRSTAEMIGQQRAAAGAGNIRIDVGTPAQLQIDSARLGEVDALRVRRNHRLEGEKIVQQMDDLQRDTENTISDLNYEADSYDERAALTILEGDAELAAGLNRSDAYHSAGGAARSAGIWNAASAGLAGAGQVVSTVDPKWFSKDK